MRSTSSSIFRSAAVVSFFTILSRIAGLARDMLQTRILGTEHSADAFNLAYRIPNLLRRLTAEGAVSAAFIPTFTHEMNRAGRESAFRVASSCLLLVSFVMTLLTVAGVLLAPWIIRAYGMGFAATPGKIDLTVLLTRLMFPYMLLISLAALAMGILNSLRVFAPSAASPVLLNLAIIVSAWFLSPHFEEPAMAFALGVVLGGVLQILIQLPALKRTGFRVHGSIDFKHPTLRRMGRLMIPALFGVGITQVNVFVDLFFGSLVGEGGVTALYLSDRVMEFILGVYTISIATAILPAISRIASEENWPEFSRTFYFGLRMVAFIILPATVGLILLRHQILAVLFERGRFDAASTSLTAVPLLYFSLGLLAFSALKILIPSFYARQDTRTPVKVAAWAMGINVLANIILLRPLGVGGPALSTTLAAYANVLTLYWIGRRVLDRHHERQFLRSLGSALLAVLPMAALLWWVASLDIWVTAGGGGRTLLLGLSILAAAGLYFLAAAGLRNPEIKELTRMISGLLRREPPASRPL